MVQKAWELQLMTHVQGNNFLESGVALSAGIFITIMLFSMIIIMSTPWQTDKEKSPVMIDFFTWQKIETPVRKKNVPLVKPLVRKKFPAPSPPKKNSEVIPQEKPEEVENIRPEPKVEKKENLVSEHKEIIDSHAQIAQKTKDLLPDPVPFFKITQSPQFLHREIPEYPENMRATGRKGIVILSVLIDKLGKVRKVTVLESGGEHFDKAAIKGMNASSFIPAKIDGKSVAVLLRMPVEFRLL